MSGNGLHRKGKRKAKKNRPQNTFMDRLEQSAHDRRTEAPKRLVDNREPKYISDMRKLTESALAEKKKHHEVPEPKEAKPKGFLRRLFNRKTGG